MATTHSSLLDRSVSLRVFVWCLPLYYCTARTHAGMQRATPTRIACVCVAFFFPLLCWVLLPPKSKAKNGHAICVYI
jgi:hypothetical protein